MSTENSSTNSLREPINPFLIRNRVLLGSKSSTESCSSGGSILESLDTAAGAASKLLDLLPHLLGDLYEEIAKRRVLVAIQNQMLSVSKSTTSEQQWNVFRIVRIGIS